jgi:hypothetical protein
MVACSVGAERQVIEPQARRYNLTATKSGHCFEVRWLDSALDSERRAVFEIL